MGRTSVGIDGKEDKNKWAEDLAWEQAADDRLSSKPEAGVSLSQPQCCLCFAVCHDFTRLRQYV